MEESDRFRLVSFLLRAGLAIVFFYAAISSLLNPTAWIGFMPGWIRDIVPGNLSLTGFSVFQLVLGTWLLSNKKIFFAAVISALTLLAILFFNTGALDIIFRDVAIFFMSLALAALSYHRH